MQYGCVVTVLQILFTVYITNMVKETPKIHIVYQLYNLSPYTCGLCIKIAQHKFILHFNLNPTNPINPTLQTRNPINPNPTNPYLIRVGFRVNIFSKKTRLTRPV